MAKILIFTDLGEYNRKFLDTITNAYFQISSDTVGSSTFGVK